MPEETTPAGQEPATNDGQAPPTPASQEPADDFDKDRALATIAKLREFEKLSKSQAKELESLRQQIKAHDDEKLSETERLKQRVSELEFAESQYKAQIRNIALRGTVAEMATRMGAVYPAAAYKLIDIDEVEFDKDGEPTNVEALLAAAKKSFPLLFRNPSGNADAASGGQPVPAVSVDNWIRKQAGIT